MTKNVKESKGRRSFGGKTDNFSDKQERAFEKAHLRAYLRGDKIFYLCFITHPVTGQRIRSEHQVKEVWTKETISHV